MKYTNHDVLILLTFRDVCTYNDVLNFIISVPVYICVHDIVQGNYPVVLLLLVWCIFM